MEYIILDLEWDSVYFPPEKRFINQILQIGAVKLDKDFNKIDTFSVTIRSAISNRVSSRFAKLTGITKEMMLSGIDFEEAVKRYNTFAENADVVMTWSKSDLYTIVENEDFILKNKLKFKLSGYLDLQKLVQSQLALKGYESKNQISLEAAAEMMEIDTDAFELHTALDDCLVCAELFRLCYNKEKFKSLLRDATKPDFFARLRFKPYPISNIHDKHIKKDELEFKCPQCGNKTRRLGSFKYRNRWFVADFQCKSCKFRFSGRVAFKKTFDDLQIKHKVCEYRPKGKKKENEVQPVPETV